MRHTNQWINWQASNLHSTTTWWLNSSCATMDGERSATQWHDFIVFPSCATTQFNSIPSLSLSLSLSLVVIDWFIAAEKFQFSIAIQKNNTTVDVGSIIHHHTFLINCPHFQINFFFINKICFKTPFSVSCCMHHHPSSHLRVFLFNFRDIENLGNFFFSPKTLAKFSCCIYTWNTNTHFSKFFPFFSFFFGNKNHLFQSQQLFVLFNLIFFLKSKILISHKKLKLRICFIPCALPRLETLNFEINFDPKTPTQKQKQWFS